MAEKAIKKTLPCYATHKGLDIIIEGKAFTIYGGSCLHPVHDNAEVYVGLDVGMTIKPFSGSGVSTRKIFTTLSRICQFLPTRRALSS